MVTAIWGCESNSVCGSVLSSAFFLLSQTSLVKTTCIEGARVVVLVSLSGWSHIFPSFVFLAGIFSPICLFLDFFWELFNKDCPIVYIVCGIFNMLHPPPSSSVFELLTGAVTYRHWSSRRSKVWSQYFLMPLSWTSCVEGECVDILHLPDWDWTGLTGKTCCRQMWCL